MINAPTVYVCTTCKRTGEPDSEPRPGALLAAATRTDGLIFVATDSSCPIGIYHVVHQPPARGELVEAC